ncbi:MAG: sigma-70 family RNA polymerase sigma factor [Agriterribacter sp.]
MTTQSIENTLEVYFIDVFRKHEYKLHTLVLCLTKSDQYAKDAIQEVFTKLWLQRNNLHTINNIELWLYKLTENKITDFFRKTAGERKLRDALWVNMRHACNDSEERESLNEYNPIIDKAINQLSPQRERIYRMSKEDGFNYQEIAHHLYVTKNTLKNKLLKAAQAVKSFIGKD